MQEAIAILRKAGVKRALISSSGDDGQQRLYQAAPDLVIPELRPYRSRGEIGTWFRDETRHSLPGGPAAQDTATSASANSTCTAPTPTCRCRAAWSSWRSKHNLFLHAHSDVDAVERLFRQWPQARILWAHAGFERPERVRRDAAQAQEPVGRPRLPHRPRLGRQGRSGVARGVPRVPRPLHGRHRQLHARSAGTTSPSTPTGRGAGSPTCRATSPSASHGKTAKRSSARCCSGRTSAVARAPAGACEPAAARARALESPRYRRSRIKHRADRGRASTSRSRSRSARSPAARARERCKVDAHMPEHRHGMNYAPDGEGARPRPLARRGADVPHAGQWEFVFEVRAAGKTDRLALLAVPACRSFPKEEIARSCSTARGRRRRARDPSNRVSGKPEAIALGEKLFFEPRLSGTGSVLCATCHAPFRAFQDAPRARLRPGRTSTATRRRCSTSRFYRWFGWDGAHDSLWSQSIRPLLDAARDARDARARRRRSVRSTVRDGLRKRVRHARRRRTTKRCWSTSARRSRRSRRRWSAAARRSTISATPWRRGDAATRLSGARRSAG